MSGLKASLILKLKSGDSLEWYRERSLASMFNRHGAGLFCFIKEEGEIEMNTLAAVTIDFSSVWPWLPTFLEGTIVTIVLSLSTVLLGSLIGLATVLMKQSRIKLVNWIADIYTNIIRGTPMLLQLFFWLYALPIVGIRFSSIDFLGATYGSREFITAVVALGINSGAYVSEVLRGGLEAVDKGQLEAGRALGLSKRETMFSIVIPQAIRTVLPGLGNEFVTMIKESSIVSVVGVFDVMYTSNVVKASTYSIFEPLIVVGVIYFVLTFSLTRLLKELEKRLNTYA